MRWTQLLAGLSYVALVVSVWVKAGVTAGLLFLACVLFLTIALRPNDAGNAIRGWAGFLYRRRPAGSSSGS